MARSRLESGRPHATSWSAPSEAIPGRSQPLFCVATTYTFHADFFETDLLPRFLGLRFDETERAAPFVVEREQALGVTTVCILVDAGHVDTRQSTLRWDQLPVRVPGGAQHSKVVLLGWEDRLRLIVSSANLTTSGYRRNREIAGVLDFYNGSTSAPRRLILDAAAFLSELDQWVQAAPAVKARFRDAINQIRNRVRTWPEMPVDSRPLERPRMAFVGGLPRGRGAVARSPLGELRELWGKRRADAVTVMTPFVGDIEGPVDRVVEALLELPRFKDTIGRLIVPGRPSEGDARTMQLGLPRRFRDAWATAWQVLPAQMVTFVVPPRRPGEKVDRELHAKGVLVEGDSTALLLYGSSNFSPHGMGIGVANVEANLCVIDDLDARRDGLRLWERLPVDWSEDLCEEVVWPDAVEEIDDEKPAGDLPLPLAFRWAAYAPNSAALTIGLDPEARLPTRWSLHFMDAAASGAPPLASESTHPTSPADGRIVIQLSAAFRDAQITGLRLHWLDESRIEQQGTLAVQVENSEDLLSPAEFRNLSVSAILDCLVSGKSPAEWVDARGSLPIEASGSNLGEAGPLRALDTSGYLLYRTRRLGTALSALAERILGSAKTPNAVAYLLLQDPLGPRALAESLVAEWSGAAENGRIPDADALLFGLAEIALTVAHVGRQISGQRSRKLFVDTIERLDRLQGEVASEFAPRPNLRTYLNATSAKCRQLLPLEDGQDAR